MKIVYEGECKDTYLVVFVSQQKTVSALLHSTVWWPFYGQERYEKKNFCFSNEIDVRMEEKFKENKRVRSVQLLPEKGFLELVSTLTGNMIINPFTTKETKGEQTTYWEMVIMIDS